MDNELVLMTQSNFIAPVADLTTALARYQAVKDFIDSILKPKVDYGTIPGSDKPALLKPGAEKMCSFFGLTPKFPLEDKEEDWTGERHGGEPFFYYRYKCQLYRGDHLIAEGEGSCNSWEKKYRYRQGERKCPKCGELKLSRLIGTGGGIIFKGSGFYETDYKRKSSPKSSKIKSSCPAKDNPGSCSCPCSP